MPSKRINLTGKRFGRLVVTGDAGHLSRYFAYACLCDCGGTTVVRGDSLRKNLTKSCGCLARETAAKVAVETGHKNRTHGRANTPLYRTKWTYSGESLLPVEWEERTGIPVGRIRKRLYLGWTIGQALGFEHRDKGTWKGGP